MTERARKRINYNSQSFSHSLLAVRLHMRQTDWIHRSAQKAVSIGRNWTVWGDRLPSEPADASDWCSHGAGSTAQIGVQAGDRLGWVAYISWAGDRAGLLGWE